MKFAEVSWSEAMIKGGTPGTIRAPACLEQLSYFEVDAAWTAGFVVGTASLMKLILPVCRS